VSLGKAAIANVPTLDIDDKDDKELARLGYEKVLYRGFDAFKSFSFNFTSVSAISTISISLGYSLIQGGPVVTVWAWVIGSVFSNIVGLVLAELSSPYPVAGGVYQWAGMLASPKWAPFASFICGWFNFLSNITGDAYFANALAQFVAAVAVLVNPDTVVTNGVQVAIAVGVTGLWGLKNIPRVDH